MLTSVLIPKSFVFLLFVCLICFLAKMTPSVTGLVTPSVGSVSDSYVPCPAEWATGTSGSPVGLSRIIKLYQQCILKYSPCSFRWTGVTRTQGTRLQIDHFRKYHNIHNTLCWSLQKFCISIVFSFSWGQLTRKRN